MDESFVVVCIPLRGNFPLMFKCCVYFVYIFSMAWYFLIKFYMLFTNCLTWYEVGTYRGDTLWKRILVSKLYTALLLNSLHVHFNFITCVEVDTSSKELHTRKYFQQKSCDHIHDVIYRPHLSKGSLNENLSNRYHSGNL